MGVSMALQVLSGILLTWYFNLTFANVFEELTNSNSGWIVRLAHIQGTGLIWLLVWTHLFKVLWLSLSFNSNYTSWFSGFIIFITITFISILGFSLPLNQLSISTITVVTNIITTLIPNSITTWLWSAHFINNHTICKCYSLHVLLPITLFILILLHLYLIHQLSGSDALDRNNFNIE